MTAAPRGRPRPPVLSPSRATAPRRPARTCAAIGPDLPWRSRSTAIRIAETISRIAICRLASCRRPPFPMTLCAGRYFLARGRRFLGSIRRRGVLDRRGALDDGDALVVRGHLRNERRIGYRRCEIPFGERHVGHRLARAAFWTTLKRLGSGSPCAGSHSSHSEPTSLKARWHAGRAADRSRCRRIRRWWCPRAAPFQGTRRTDRPSGSAMSYRSASASSVRSIVSGIGACANTFSGCDGDRHRLAVVPGFEAGAAGHLDVETDWAGASCRRPSG